jgi:transposase
MLGRRPLCGIKVPEPSMGEVSTIGLDIAKSVFQVHGVDESGAVVMRKRVSRSQVLEFFGGLSPCLIGIEACSSAHYWSRELQAFGHMVKLMPSYVKAYLKRGKNGANDAAAICEAVTRPSMRFVPIKTQEQQTGLMLHRTRQMMVRQRTMLSNAIRGIWPNSASSRPKAAMARLSCCRLLAMWRTIGFHRLPGFVSIFLLANI